MAPAVPRPSSATDISRRDIAFAEFLELLFGGRLAITPPNPGADRFSKFDVRHADNLDVTDLRVGVEVLLNRDWQPVPQESLTRREHELRETEADGCSHEVLAAAV